MPESKAADILKQNPEMERTKMERKPYSAGAVKFSFWFMEFRKTVQLLSEGKSFADIKKLNEEKNKNDRGDDVLSLW